MHKVIPKTLWIDQVIHALTVTKAWVIHALTVTISRINGHHTIYSLYLPIVKTPVVGASLFGDNLAGCHPNRLHLPPTAVLKNSIKTKLPLILLAVGLAGCQPKSEVDKCVEALLLHACRNAPESGKEDPSSPKWNIKTCKESMASELSANYRLQCMRAQAGGK
jgi:hypothetical protein